MIGAMNKIKQKESDGGGGISWELNRDLEKWGRGGISPAEGMERANAPTQDMLGVF